MNEVERRLSLLVPLNNLRSHHKNNTVMNNNELLPSPLTSLSLFIIKNNRRNSEQLIINSVNHLSKPDREQSESFSLAKCRVTGYRLCCGRFVPVASIPEATMPSFVTAQPVQDDILSGLVRFTLLQLIVT